MSPRTRSQEGGGQILLALCALSAVAFVNGEADGIIPNRGTLPAHRSLQNRPPGPVDVTGPPTTEPTSAFPTPTVTTTEPTSAFPTPTGTTITPPELSTCPTPALDCGFAGIWNPFECACVCISGFVRVNLAECQHGGSGPSLQAPNPWENCDDEDDDLANNCPFFPVVHGRGEFICEQRSEPGPGIFTVGLSMADCLCKLTGEVEDCNGVDLSNSIFVAPPLAPSSSANPTATLAPPSVTRVPTTVPTSASPTAELTSTSPTATPTSQPSSCDGPPLGGCGYGIFSEETCQCICAEGLCGDQCFQACEAIGSSNIAPFSGCVPGENCPWFPSATTDLRCLSSAQVPAGTFTIYATPGECCDTHFNGVPDCESLSIVEVGVLKELFYYPDLNGAENCVFDGDWDDWMNLPGFTEFYLFPFENAQECCDLWYPDAPYCPQELPSTSPSASPSLSNFPSISPTDHPSGIPSVAPSGAPSSSPSSAPSSNPSSAPSDAPSAAPSSSPSSSPSSTPSSMPSLAPSESGAPSTSAQPSAPTQAPSNPPFPLTAKPTTPPPTNLPTTPPPTNLPTTLPPTTTPTSRPTNLEPAAQAGPWHIALDGNANCYNDDDYPDIWNGDQFSALYLFDTAAECCAVWFKTSAECAVATRELALLNGAPMSDNTPLMVQAAASAVASEPAQLLWHIVVNHPGQPHCTNDPDYPEEWNHPDHQHLYLFSTADLCCDVWFETTGCGIDQHDLDRRLGVSPDADTEKVMGNDSAHENVGPKRGLRVKTERNSNGAHHSKEEARRLADAYTREELHKWYPKKAQKTCVNDGKAPEYMLLPGYPELFLFETKAECCAQYDCSGLKLRTGRRR